MVSRYSKYVKKYSEFSLKLDKVVLLKVILSLLRIAVLLQKCNSSGYLARCFARARAEPSEALRRLSTSPLDKIPEFEPPPNTHFGTKNDPKRLM